jgi:hypothetical protein
MALDPNIALGVRGIEIANPLAQYSQVAQIQNAQNQNALAQFQLGAAQRTEKSQNLLADAYAQSTDPATGKIDYNKLTSLVAAGGGGTQIPAIQKSRLEYETAQTTQQKAQTELLDARLKQSRGFLDTLDPNDPTAPARYIAWHEANHKDPIIGPALAARGVSVDQSRQSIESAIAKGPAAFANLLNQSKLGTEKFMELNKPTTQVVDQSGQRQVLQIPGLGGTPTSVGTYSDVPLPANVQAQKIQIAQASKPVQSVTMVQEKAESADYGKFLVDQFKNVTKASDLALKSMPAIESNLNILDKGFDTGFGTETKAAGAKVLGALGVKDAEKYATDSQSFLSNANAAVLQKQLEQKGPQTEADAQRITTTGAQLGNTKDANKFVLNVAKAQLQRDIDQRNFYADWRKANRTLDGAEDAWNAGPGSKSLFERPELKKYTAPTKANVNATPTAARPPLDSIFAPR